MQSVPTLLVCAVAAGGLPAGTPGLKSLLGAGASWLPRRSRSRASHRQACPAVLLHQVSEHAGPLPHRPGPRGLSSSCPFYKEGARGRHGARKAGRGGMGGGAQVRGWHGEGSCRVSWQVAGLGKCRRGLLAVRGEWGGSLGRGLAGGWARSPGATYPGPHPVRPLEEAKAVCQGPPAGSEVSGQAWTRRGVGPLRGRLCSGGWAEPLRGVPRPSSREGSWGCSGQQPASRPPSLY